MNTNSVILVGCFCEMVELCRRSGLKVAGAIDASRQVADGLGVPYLGVDEEVLSNPGRLLETPLVVVPDAPALRCRIVERYRAAGFRFGSVISPDADLSPSCEIGEGAVVQSHVVVTAQARIGAFAKLNIGARVFHECRVGEYVTIAPGATLLGRVHVLDQAYVGASSTILPGRSIGRGSMVGAGAVVTRDVADGLVVVGVPARKLEYT